jgi:carbamoyltransferase
VNYIPPEYVDEYNLFPEAKHYELSHHLAHVWSCITSSPFNTGLVVVMDGMGESYNAMQESMSALESHSKEYMHDLKLLQGIRTTPFVQVPSQMHGESKYREAESAYVFDGLSVSPVFKRWSRERSPSELFNHGFENMESMGAVYSRIATHTHGDWNVCGKIMGLASWSGMSTQDVNKWCFSPDATLVNPTSARSFDKMKRRFMEGNPFLESGPNAFKVNWGVLSDLPHPNQWSDDRFGFYADISHRVQLDLEDCAMQLLESLHVHSKTQNLCLTGGVALNSVLNGIVMRSGLFEKVYIPPCPGDDGIALGCAMYGLHKLSGERLPTSSVPPVFSPYTGRIFSDDDIIGALDDFGLYVTMHSCCPP